MPDRAAIARHVLTHPIHEWTGWGLKIGRSTDSAHSPAPADFFCPTDPFSLACPAVMATMMANPNISTVCPAYFNATGGVIYTKSGASAYRRGGGGGGLGWAGFLQAGVGLTRAAAAAFVAVVTVLGTAAGGSGDILGQ